MRGSFERVSGSVAWMEYNEIQEVREEDSSDCIRATLLCHVQLMSSYSALSLCTFSREVMKHQGEFSK